MRLTHCLTAALLGIAVVSAAAAAAADAAEQTADDLYALVGERLSHMRDVAAFKWLSELPVEDLPREQVVVAAALEQARNRGLRPGGSEAFFREQIEAAKDIQNYWFERWRSGGGPLTAPDLAGEIRPRLLELGDQIIAGLGQPLAHDSDTFATLVATEGLPKERVERLYLALRQVARYHSRLEQILASGTLRVGTTGDYAPFSEADGDPGEGWAASLIGVDVDLARDLAAALGVAVEFVPTSWPTLSEDLRAGRFDVAMSGVSRTLDRARTGHLSLPYYTGGKTPIARCEDRERFDSLEEIVPGTLAPGSVRGGRFARRNLPIAGKRSEVVQPHPVDEP